MSEYDYCDQLLHFQHVKIEAADLRPSQFVRVGFQPDIPMDYRNDSLEQVHSWLFTGFCLDCNRSATRARKSVTRFLTWIE